MSPHDHRGISSPFGELCPTVRQITNVLRTRLPLIILGIATKNNPLDLHALDTPPAFILSQDQTLNKNTFYPRIKRINRLTIMDPILSMVTILLSKSVSASPRGR